MNRQKGLLAFLCAAIACTCAVLQIPWLSGLGEFSGDQPPLAAHLGSAQSLRKDRRPDSEIERLASAHQLPFWPLKAHLAITSKGVRGTEGMFWSRLPEGDAELPDDGLARTRAAASLLGRYRAETGSLAGALAAWEVGPYRARRAVPAEGPRAEDLPTALRLRMLAAHRQDAQAFLCSVLGLASALDTRWPVEDRDVFAPMAGRIVFANVDGARGRCVVMQHACRLIFEACGLESIEAPPGEWVQKGRKLGTVGSRPPHIGLRTDHSPLDPAVLRPPEEESP